MNFNLKAREEISLELKGSISPSCIKGLLPKELKPLVINEMTPVGLQLAHVEQLNWNRIPFLKLHFYRAFWSIGVLEGTQKGWYLAICDLDHPWVRYLGAAMLKYPVRNADFSFLEKRKSLITQHQPDTGGEMRCHIELGAENEPEESFSLFYVKQRNGVKKIRVTDSIPGFCRTSKADIIKDELSQEIFGMPVKWKEQCYVFRGRTFDWSEFIAGR